MWFFQSATLKEPEPAVLQNSKSHPTMVCTPNQIFISVANFGNQLANVLEEVLEKSVLQCNFH